MSFLLLLIDKMSELTSKSVIELKLLCKSKGLKTTGLKKAQLIEVLLGNATTDDIDCADTTENGGSTENNEDLVQYSDDDVIEDDDDEIGECTEDDVEVNPESSSVKKPSSNDKLKLQIELAKLEIQRLKLVAKSGESVTEKRDNDRVKIDRSLQGLLPRMSNNDGEALNFFHAFERVLLLYNIEKHSWALYLPANLNVHATKIYARLTIDQCKDYDAIKTEILKSFRLTSRSYYDQFISSKKRQGENFCLFLNRLSELQSCYMESKKLDTYNQLRDDNLLMQFLSVMPIDVRKFVEARTPSSPLEAAQLGDLYVETQQSRREFEILQV